MNKTVLSLAIGVAVSSSALAVSGTSPSTDFGFLAEQLLKKVTPQFFGIASPLPASETVTVARSPNQTASQLIKLADGLKAEIVSRKAAHSSDQMAFWPNDTAPTHIVSCVEVDNEQIGTFPSTQPKLKPSVQTVNLVTGEIKTILRGMIGCDGVRRTPWNTVVVTEEVDDGGLYEILNPLTTAEQTLVARGASDTIDTDGNPVTGQIEFRSAIGTLAWEGLDITRKGVVYFGDEARPGTNGADADGGSLFKFVPTTPWNGAAVKTLDKSPLVSGNVYAYQASCQNRTNFNFPQFGQGCEIGEGAWVKVDPIALRASASVISATGFYRPEDGHFDPKYRGPGVKFCWNNTGNASAQNFGEVICLLDANPIGTGEKLIETEGVGGQGWTYLADSAQTNGLAVAIANRVLEGDPQLNQPDNLAFQPNTGNMYVVEDNPFGDVWACLRDGRDRDIKTDGCIRTLSVRDSSAEPTGFTFTADGKTAYLFIQHSDDTACTEGVDCAQNDDFATDDLIKISGFKDLGNN